jgi:hypothetical protein
MATMFRCSEHIWRHRQLVKFKGQKKRPYGILQGTLRPWEFNLAMALNHDPALESQRDELRQYLVDGLGTRQILGFSHSKARQLEHDAKSLIGDALGLDCDIG